MGRTILASSTALLITILAALTSIASGKELYPVYSWKYVDYVFPSAAVRNAAIQSKQFIIGNPFIIDADAYYGATTKQFVTTPRFLDGTPITLGVVSSTNGPGGPLIAPYPNYGWHNTTNCEGFTSVFRVAIDECQRLWVIDTGKIGERQVCPPQIVIFDLRTDVCLYIYKFAPNMYNSMTSLFITPVVDVRNTCTDTKLYLADVTGFAVIVYDYRYNKAWKVQHRLFNPDPNYSRFSIAGDSFDLMDGVFGMSISPKNAPNRQLYFHSLAANSENSVLLSTLDNSQLWEQNPNSAVNSLVTIGYRGNSQATISAIDRNGNQFFGTVNPIGIGCWDTATVYRIENLKVVAQNDVTLQFISGLKLVTNRAGAQELYTLSCRFQKIMNENRNINEINYRMQAITVNELLSNNVKCYGAPFPLVTKPR